MWRYTVVCLEQFVQMGLFISAVLEVAVPVFFEQFVQANLINSMDAHRFFIWPHLK